MKAAEAKNKGNAAFSAQDFPTAVTHFTEAIQHDPTNHVLFSNRSASYASMGKYKEALEDANETVKLKPDWARVSRRIACEMWVRCLCCESESCVMELVVIVYILSNT